MSRAVDAHWALPIVVLAAAILAVGCAGNDEVEPSGSIVVFGAPGGSQARGEEIGLIPATGGNAQPLLSISYAFNDVAFSPDASHVAFNAQHGGIRVMRLEDRHTTLIPNQPSQDRFLHGDIAWAPDGKSLAFVNGAWIFTISIDGADLREVVRGSFPTWTPDGKHIVFGAGLYRGPDLDIAVVRTDGTERRLLGRGLFPDVSPSGDAVAYSTSAGIVVQPLASGPPRMVVRDGFGPVWSPDGKFLAFTRYTDCSSFHGPCSGRVFVVSIEGGLPRPIGPEVGDPGAPVAWIP